VLAGLGAVLGMAVVSLVSFIRHRQRQLRVHDGVAREEARAAMQSGLAPGGQTERNGNPILRVAAGLVALMFTAIVLLMLVQGQMGWEGCVLVVALAIMFGWYAARGNKGLPRFLTKR
jgi:hypothetical protein